MNHAARRRLLWLLGLAALAVATAVILLLPRPGQGIASGPEPLAYVGARVCDECHADEQQRWRGSHHARALQPAAARTVQGDFGGARFAEGGVSARFRRRGAGFFVRTAGPDGKPGEYRIAYTLGVSPLQQYLVEMPGGRYQVLGLAWDARPRRRGGQRWFREPPDEGIDHRHPLHWTRPAQNWNSRCAECHATNVAKGYRQDEERFATTFVEPGVSCEGCHGPGSRHVSWAGEARSRGRAPKGDPGLVVRFSERRSRNWEMDAARGIARPTRFLETRFEVETCARCHARRELLSEEWSPGRLLAETHRPSLLEEGLYYADGQMRGEVYEWGPFLQSRMYAAGVTCSDCHDPHDQQVKVGRDAVCSSCHQPERFATRKHHFHREGGSGSSCVACHMRTERFRLVDERHDHSFRVPRPDLTVSLGRENAPNACNDCHRDRSPSWAAGAVRRFFPQGRSGTPHYGQVLLAARRHAPGAERALVALLRDPKQPAIVRATAVSLLDTGGGSAAVPTIQKAASDPDPLVRLAAASVVGGLRPQDRLKAGVSLLWDPVRAVRVEAVPAFADLPDAQFESEQRAAFDRALDEYLLAQRTSAERPESHVNVGLVYAKRGRLEEAGRAYEAALRLRHSSAAALAGLSELHALSGRPDEAEAVLRKALRWHPNDPELHEALGLLLGKRKRPTEGLAQLRRASELAPAEPRRAELYATALRAAGRPDEALAVLRAAHRRSPGASGLLRLLVSITRDQGSAEAERWARRLLESAPEDPEARVLAEAVGVTEEAPVDGK